jgi:hypothetical protein
VLTDQHVTSKNASVSGLSIGRVLLLALAGAPWSVHLRTPEMYSRRAVHMLQNTDKGCGSLSLGVVTTGRDWEYCINKVYNSVFPFLSGVTTLCDITQEGMSCDISKNGLRMIRRNISKKGVASYEDE